MENNFALDLEKVIKTGLDISPDCFGILNQEDTVVYCNNTFASIFAMPKEEVIGKTNRALLELAWFSKQGINIDADDFDIWYENVEKLHDQKKLNQFETDLTNGRWFKITRVSLGDGYTLLFGVDITDLKKTQQSLEIANKQIEALANTDQLTRVNNRRAFKIIANQELKRSVRYQHPFSLLILDLDFFKKVNDNYGHEAGDFVLKEFAKICKGQLRQSDSLSRFGGEEFTIILPMTDGPGAYKLAEKIRSKIEHHDFYNVSLDCHIQVTVSIGISSLIAPSLSVKDLLVKADIALYSAKQNGRNQVIDYHQDNSCSNL